MTSTAADQFARLSRDLLQTLRAPEQVRAEGPRALARRLALLYAAACDLPLGSPGSSEPRRDIDVPTSFNLGIQLYSTTLDAADPSSGEACGDLDDDLHDIALDLARGLDIHEAGDTPTATWLWRFSFESHWGAHAVEALRVLHTLAARDVPHPRTAE